MLDEYYMELDPKKRNKILDEGLKEEFAILSRALEDCAYVYEEE